MKISLTINQIAASLLLSLFGASSVIATIDCTHLPNGLYANPDNCTTFYKCSNGYAYLYDCVEGTAYIPTYQICDYAWKYSDITCPQH
jgi:hypothetical protein